MTMIRSAVRLGAMTIAASAASAEPVLVPYWTPVPIRFNQTVSSRDAMLGQMVEAEIADDVVVGGHTVFRKGLPIWADVCDVKKKGGFGDAGRVEVKVVFAPAGSNSVRVTGRVKSKGESGVAGAVVAGVVFGIPGALIVTGRSGKIPTGTTLLAHVEEEKTVEVKAPVLASAL